MSDMLARRSILSLALPAALGLLSPGPARAADQPHMRAAMEALKTAKSELASAEADKGGHRANAVKLVNQAIAEVEAGIKYAQSH